MRHKLLCVSNWTTHKQIRFKMILCSHKQWKYLNKTKRYKLWTRGNCKSIYITMPISKRACKRLVKQRLCRGNMLHMRHVWVYVNRFWALCVMFEFVWTVSVNCASCLSVCEPFLSIVRHVWVCVNRFWALCVMFEFVWTVSGLCVSCLSLCEPNVMFYLTTSFRF